MYLPHSSEIYIKEQPPFLEPSKTIIDGLAFLGLSLTQNHYPDISSSHPTSTSHQSSWNFNEIQDRDYKHIATTSDDGWLVGGGENGDSYKLPARDSAHVEIMRIGTFDRHLGTNEAHRLSLFLSCSRPDDESLFCVLCVLCVLCVF